MEVQHTYKLLATINTDNYDWSFYVRRTWGTVIYSILPPIYFFIIGPQVHPTHRLIGGPRPHTSHL